MDSGDGRGGKRGRRPGALPVRYLDAFESSRRGRSLAGEVPLAEFGRLVADLPLQCGSASWRVQGETGARGEALLRLAVRAAPQVICQRCLQTFSWPIETEVVLELVKSEEELDAGPLSSDDLESEHEKVLGSGRFDLYEQLEDELILSLPYIPRHPECVPDAPDDTAEPEPERRNPFAALGELKGRLTKD